MREITPAQMTVLARLVARGFQPVAFPLYASFVGIRRGSFAALLESAPAGGFRPPAQAFYMIEGNLAVRVSRSGRDWFVWKTKQVEATPDLLAGLAQFSADLAEIIS